MPKHKEIHLTCRRDFGRYRRGDHIDDDAEVNRILKGELRHHVVKVRAELTPEPVSLVTKRAPFIPSDKASASE